MEQLVVVVHLRCYKGSAGAADFCDNNLFYVDVLACVNIH